MYLSKIKTNKLAIEKNDIALEETRHTEGSPINLKDKVIEMNKLLYKGTVNLDKIAKLEKDTIRGECLVKPEARTIQKPRKKPDLLTMILKSEHKATLEGTQILKLPKLPFGKHKSYNDDGAFKDKHFLESDTTIISPERNKDLEEITRKFRLHEKKYKASKRNRMHSARIMLSDFAFYDVYDMGPGKLVCGREEEVVRGYEKDKERYKEITKGNFAYTYKDVNEEKFERKYAKRIVADFKTQQKLIMKLLPSREVKDSTLSQFYSTKYSSLFENNDIHPRVKVRRSSLS
ncbi:hypothetical protein SteCoe_25542 [Stentor coeruleus]|uniref:Uncharacterized protein n=1 Tax=Stentor coeruleus TaxID=5963 RepID=A0A1R2BFC5_9CILI|nr:hypothetical protein SteCoe_25542 [Stentor coeruleus]